MNRKQHHASGSPRLGGDVDLDRDPLYQCAAAQARRIEIEIQQRTGALVPRRRAIAGNVISAAVALAVGLLAGGAIVAHWIAAGAV